MISKYDLTQEQWEQVEKLANDSKPGGQFFWIENEKVFVADKKDLELWIAQGGDQSTIINFRG